MNKTASARRHPVSRLLVAVLAVAPAAWSAGDADAQATASYCDTLRAEVPSDYYAARGCGMLQVAEMHHLGPGRGKVKTRNYAGAAGDFQFILRIFPNHPQALVGLAETCEQWRTPDRVVFCELEEWFTRARDINPKAAGTYIAEGIYHHRRGKYNEARASFEQAVALEPTNANAQYNLALAYVELKQYAKANEHAQQAYALGSTLPGLRDRLQRAGSWKPSASAPGPTAKSSN